MIYHESAEFPSEERQELGRRLRDAAIDWIYDLSVAHSRSQDEFVAFLKSYHLYRTRLIILLKLGFRVGLIPANSYATLEGDLMEQEKVVAHQIELLESGRGMHTGALTSRSAARSAQVADRDRRGGSRGRDDRDDRPRSRMDSRDDRPARAPERDDRFRGRDDRDDRFAPPSREPVAPPARSRSRFEEEPPAAAPSRARAPRVEEEAPAPARTSGRRVSSRNYDELTSAAYPAAEETAPAPRTPARRASTRTTEEEPAPARTPGRRVSSRPAADIPAPAAATRRASSRDDDFDDDDTPAPRVSREPVEASAATPVRRRRRTAVAEAVAAPVVEESAVAPTRRRRS